MAGRSIRERKLVWGEAGLPALRSGLNACTRTFPGDPAAAGSGWSAFPKASWENPQAARPPAAAPPFHSWKSTGSAGAWKPQANAWLLCGLTMASADSFVLGPAMEENSFPKKHFKKCGKYPQLKCLHRVGAGSLLDGACIGRFRL